MYIRYRLSFKAFKLLQKLKFPKDQNLIIQIHEKSW